MPQTRLRKGDAVKFRFAMRPVQGIVKEDRGPIGVGGRRLYLIEFRLHSESEMVSEIELPAERLQVVRETVSRD